MVRGGKQEGANMGYLETGTWEINRGRKAKSFKRGAGGEPLKGRVAGPNPKKLCFNSKTSKKGGENIVGWKNENHEGYAGW